MKRPLTRPSRPAGRGHPLPSERARIYWVGSNPTAHARGLKSFGPPGLKSTVGSKQEAEGRKERAEPLRPLAYSEIPARLRRCGPSSDGSPTGFQVRHALWSRFPSPVFGPKDADNIRGDLRLQALSKGTWVRGPGFLPETGSRAGGRNPNCLCYSAGAQRILTRIESQALRGGLNSFGHPGPRQSSWRKAAGSETRSRPQTFTRIVLDPGQNISTAERKTGGRA